MSKTQTRSLFSTVSYVQNYPYHGYQIKRDSYMAMYEGIETISHNGATETVWRWVPTKDDAEQFIRAQQRVARPESSNSLP